MTRRIVLKKPREQEIVNACLALLQSIGAVAWRQNQGAMAGEYKGKRRFVRFAGIQGISDIIGCLPGGRFIAVECKRKGKKPTPAQWEFLDRVRASGGIVVPMCTDLKDLEMTLRKNGYIE